jgi:uncharacterized protein (TIGR02270 family)
VEVALLTARNTPSIPPLHGVVSQHADEAVVLRHQRARLVDSPDVGLLLLRRHDDRIAAHLDGLAVAGEYGANVAMAMLDSPGVAEAFVAGVRAIEDKNAARLDALFRLAESVPQAESGLTSAFGWVSSNHLQGTVSQLLSSPASCRRRVGIAACAMHRVDPLASLDVAIADPDATLRARALRTVGEIGRRESLSSLSDALGDEDDGCRLRAAWSAVILGERHKALQVLLTAALAAAAPDQARAFRLALQAMNPQAVQGVLQNLAKEPSNLRRLIQGSGIAGDTVYVPWLIRHMTDATTSRVAGEAFTLITGADLDKLQLYRPQPADFESGPNDNPEDPIGDMDPDEGLMWPDQQKVDQWWAENSARFPKGQRYFMGAPVTREHCINILKNGYQRQRILAAQYLCLLEPGTPLFNTSAPAWRQQRLLAKMS